MANPAMVKTQSDRIVAMTFQMSSVGKASKYWVIGSPPSEQMTLMDTFKY